MVAFSQNILDDIVEPGEFKDGKVHSMSEKETGRLEAFSDGVFAVAITLLILNIKIPGLDLPNDRDLWNVLGSEWSMFAAYAISFLTIGIMWLNHHRLFVHIKRIDTILLFINLLLLLIIVFIPFPTALLAEYMGRPDLHAAAILYSGICLLMACGFNVLWRYASYHDRLLGKNVNREAVEAISRQYLFGPLAYLVVFALAWISPPVSIALLFLLAIFFALPSRTVRSLSMRRPAKELSTNTSADEQIEELEL